MRGASPLSSLIRGQGTFKGICRPFPHPSNLGLQDGHGGSDKRVVAPMISPPIRCVLSLWTAPNSVKCGKGLNRPKVIKFHMDLVHSALVIYSFFKSILQVFKSVWMPIKNRSCITFFYIYILEFIQCLNCNKCTLLVVRNTQSALFK